MPYIPRHLHVALKSALDAYAWPGGYPVYAVLDDGESLCPSCARENVRLILSATHDRDIHSGWYFVGAHINWEDSDLYCAHCYKPLEPAYPPDMDVSI